VVALETVETWFLPAADFEELGRCLPAVHEQLMVTLARRLRRMNERLLEALFVPAADRVLCRLVEAAAHYGSGEGAIDVPLAQRDLAELAGTTPETANRVLRREEARGTVQLGRRRIRVMDIETLTRDVKQSSKHRGGRR
jgi:CRP-like cAMP-binding protein